MEGRKRDNPNQSVIPHLMRNLRHDPAQQKRDARFREHDNSKYHVIPEHAYHSGTQITLAGFKIARAGFFPALDFKLPTINR